MMRWATCALATTAVLLVLGGGRVQAELVDFSYSWSISPGAVIEALSGGTGAVSIALSSSGTSSAELGSMSPAGIPAATVTTTSSASSQTPDVFSAVFGLTLHLTDTASTQTGDLTFGGSISGSLTADASTLTSTFDNPLTKTVTLGGRDYTVTIDPVVANLPAPGAAPVLLDALVKITSSSGEPVKTPEPSSLALGGSALLLFALARRRRV